MFPNLLAEMAANGQITQKALAAELGLSEKTMGAKMAGQADFKYSEMKKLQRKFHKSLDYLFSETRNVEN